MNANANVSGSASDRASVRWALVLRYVALFVVAGVSAGCGEIVMENPKTGMIAHCPVTGIDPWSQTMACVADHEAQGWIRVGEGE
jgi:hypothetical protein